MRKIKQQYSHASVPTTPIVHAKIVGAGGDSGGLCWHGGLPSRGQKIRMTTHAAPMGAHGAGTTLNA